MNLPVLFNFGSMYLNNFNMNEQTSKKDYLLPISIIFAALLIAGSWIYTAELKRESVPVKEANQEKTFTASIDNAKPISSSDHIRGNPNAPIKIIEFSDLECPFCKKFHYTMSRLLEEYDGQIAWIYRHFPIEFLHPLKAQKAAEAAECANELGGNEKFWAYLDRYFEITPSNNNIDINEIPKIGEYIGLDKNKFEACINSRKYKEHVESEAKEAEDAGALGTPYSILIAKDGTKSPVKGAVPYDTMKLFIKEALK